MLERFAELLLTDTLTIQVIAVLALIAASKLGSALESGILALAMVPVLLAFGIIGNLAVTGMGLTEPMSQLTFREADAAESLVSLSMTLLAVSAGIAIGCFAILRAHKTIRQAREPQEA